MNNAELRELNKSRRVHQIAWVTRDLEKSMQAWIDTLRVGPWQVLTFTNETLDYLQVDGRTVTEPFEFLIGITWMGEVQLELIQPVSGPTIYEDHLRRKGEGLHHIKEYIPDERTEGTLADYLAKGIKVTQTGKFDTDYHYYLDTEPMLDFVLELGNCPILDLPPELFTMYPPEDA